MVMRFDEEPKMMYFKINPENSLVWFSAKQPLEKSLIPMNQFGDITVSQDEPVFSECDFEDIRHLSFCVSTTNQSNKEMKLEFAAKTER